MLTQVVTELHMVAYFNTSLDTRKVGFKVKINSFGSSKLLFLIC
jgi:hypothetical protein